jgi:hypothetical protein
MIDRQPTIYCNGCGNPKRETNHWFIAFAHKHGVIHNSDNPLAYITITEWDNRAALDHEAVHLCGETCAHKALSYFLQHKSLVGFKPTAAA